MIDNTKDSRFSQKQLVIIYTIISLLTLLVIWELVARFTKASMFLPAASTVLGAFFKSFVEPVGKYTMLAHIGISLYRVPFCWQRLPASPWASAWATPNCWRPC